MDGNRQMSLKNKQEAWSTDPSASVTEPYPWAVCIARFLRRLLFGVLVWIVLLVLAVMSALPYGNSDGVLVHVLRYATVVLPCWAMAGFLPPVDTWGHAYSARRIAVYFLIISLIPGAVALWAFNAMALDKEDRTALRDRRDAAIRACSADLKALTAPVIADSVLIDSGLVDLFMLRDLLGYRSMQFVELRAHERREWNGEETRYDVRSILGNESARFDVPRGVDIVRVALARKGDPSCRTGSVLGLHGYIGKAPIAPDACLRVELDQQSRASHVLKAIPAESGPEFIQWTILEQDSGTLLARLTSDDAPLRPSMTPSTSKSEQKTIGDDTVDCRSPHFSLMNLIHGPARKENERLSLGQRFVAIDLDQTSPADPASWGTFAAGEEAVDDWNDRKAARSGPGWHGAYHAAERSGWAPYAGGVIDFDAGEIVLARLSVKPSYNTEVRGSDQGFMVAWPTGENSNALAYFGLDGRLRWKRVIVSADPHQEARFSLVGMEWEPHEVRLYGFRRINAGQSAQVRVLNVPLARPAGPPARIAGEPT